MGIPPEVRLEAEARSAYEAGRLEEAIGLFRRLRDQGGEGTAMGSYGLGVALLMLGREAEAETALLDAMRGDPRHADTVFYLGYLAERHGQANLAVARYEHALAMNADHYGARAGVKRLLAEGS